MVAPAEPPLEPSSRTRSLAQESGDRLSMFADRDLELPIPGSADRVTLPAAAVRVLVDALARPARGNAVAVVARAAHYTVDDVASALDLPRAVVIEEMDAGHLPFQGTGEDRRVDAADVAAFRRVMYDRRLAALAELSALDQELGLA
jgi:hypothetical protein